MKQLLKAALFACLPAASFAETVIVPSAGSVSETVQRLQVSLEGAGARVFGIVDFGGGAKSIGEDIGEIQLVIFGDPKIGTAVLSIEPMAALDLPAKVLVYDAGNGTVMAYEVPANMLAEWNIPVDAAILQVMAKVLDAITTEAAK